MADTKPQEDLLSTVAVTATTSGGAPPAVPTAEPPSSVAAAGTDGVTATIWVNNQKFNALWCIAENRNSWVGVAGVGWLRLANNSDSAVVALTMLASHAKQAQAPVNYRQESDNMIHEMYVW
jgi:hypothetical protein